MSATTTLSQATAAASVMDTHDDQHDQHLPVAPSRITTDLDLSTVHNQVGARRNVLLARERQLKETVVALYKELNAMRTTHKQQEELLMDQITNTNGALSTLETEKREIADTMFALLFPPALEVSLPPHFKDSDVVALKDGPPPLLKPLPFVLDAELHEAAASPESSTHKKNNPVSRELSNLFFKHPLHQMNLTDADADGPTTRRGLSKKRDDNAANNLIDLMSRGLGERSNVDSSCSSAPSPMLSNPIFKEMVDGHDRRKQEIVLRALQRVRDDASFTHFRAHVNGDRYPDYHQKLAAKGVRPLCLYDVVSEAETRVQSSDLTLEWVHQKLTGIHDAAVAYNEDIPEHAQVIQCAINLRETTIRRIKDAFDSLDAGKDSRVTDPPKRKRATA